MINKQNKTHWFIYQIIWIFWLFAWVIVPYRLIRPMFFDKFIYMKDSDYGYKIGKNGSGCTAGLNSDGYRDKEFYPKTDDEYLIAVVGDSFVYGQGLKIKNRFTNLLENKLNSLKKRKVRVLNIGKCGANIYIDFVAMNKFIGKFHPDLTILALFENDLFIYPDKSDVPPFVDSNIGPVISDSIDEPSKYKEHILGAYDSKSANHKMLLEILNRLPKDGFLPFLLSVNKMPSFAEQTMLREFSDRGFPIINSFDLFNEKYKILASKNKYGLVISKREYHPNSLANKMYAERLFQEITGNPRWGFIQTIQPN